MPLGAGGMSQASRARDIRLARKSPVKIRHQRPPANQSANRNLRPTRSDTIVPNRSAICAIPCRTWDRSSAVLRIASVVVPASNARAVSTWTAYSQLYDGASPDEVRRIECANVERPKRMMATLRTGSREAKKSKTPNMRNSPPISLTMKSRSSGDLGLRRPHEHAQHVWHGIRKCLREDMRCKCSDRQERSENETTQRHTHATELGPHLLPLMGRQP